VLKGSGDSYAAGILLDISPAMKIAGIKKVLPNTKTIGMVYSPGSAEVYDSYKAECAKNGIELKAKIINGESEFSGALNEILQGVDCFMIIVDPKIYYSQTVKYLLLESGKNKCPVVGLSSFYTKAGALVSFDCDYKDIGAQSADIAAKILGGEDPSAIGVQNPRKVRYTINMVTAGKMGIKIPPQAAKEASEVIN
jgi:putative tryptophan/tyrosine transport system substrate-binding protein